MSPINQKTRVLVIGSAKLADLCSGLDDVDLAGAAIDDREAIHELGAGNIDIVLIDLEMLGPGNLERLRSLSEASSGAQIIVVVRDGGIEDLAQALSSGAAGFISGEPIEQEVSDAIKVVRAGGSYMDATRTRLMLDEVRAGQRAVGAEEPAALSAREKEVLLLLSEGLSARQIATRLALSERTVNTHVANVYRKLGVSNRVEAVRAAMRMGISRDHG